MKWIEIVLDESMYRCGVLMTALVVALGGVCLSAQIEGRKVSGVVVAAATDRPVSDAQVNYEEDGVVQRTRTDEKGYFEFPRGSLGVVTVTATGFGTAYARWPSFGGGQLRVVLRPPVTVSGVVMDMATKEPAVGATVTVMVDTVDYNFLSDTTTTGSRGAFRFDDLPPASAQAAYLVHSHGFAPGFGLFAVDDKDGASVRIGLLLEARASGYVRDARGHAVPGAVVSGTYEDSLQGAGFLEGLVGGRMITGSDGAFTLNGIVPDQPLALQATMDDGRVSNIVTVTIVPGTLRGEIDLRIPSR